MPFKSESQRRYLYAKEPAVAAEFQSKTPAGTHLPAKVKPKSKGPTGVLKKKMTSVPG